MLGRNCFSKNGIFGSGFIIWGCLCSCNAETNDEGILYGNLHSSHNKNIPRHKSFIWFFIYIYTRRLMSFPVLIKYLIKVGFEISVVVCICINLYIKRPLPVINGYFAHCSIFNYNR